MSSADLISSIKAMRPAVPAKDYAESRRFYEGTSSQGDTKHMGSDFARAGQFNYRFIDTRYHTFPMPRPLN